LTRVVSCDFVNSLDLFNAIGGKATPMPGIYSEDLKRRVREANNLVDIVQSVVGKLVKTGRNLKACCPFHAEKTPSFNVNIEGQYFKCFGCGKSGDVFTFVQLHERVEFPEAFKILADRAGIKLETDPVAAQQYAKEKDWKSYLYKLNNAAANFYREQLFAPAGEKAREYLKKRGLSDENCEKFRLGYAPAGGSPLLARLQSQKAPVAAVIKAGLASQREDGPARDFFFDRLMFPIEDIQGRVIAFGGRILGDGEPKYLNTRDTLLFSKTHTVYGLNLAKAEILKTRTAIIVEGYTDVMMCHQYGVTNVVACLGTAITPEHVRHLRRVADQLTLLTDSDRAGEQASERSLEVLFAEDMPARVVRLPNSEKDPCDFLLAHGKEPFVQALERWQELFEYKFEMVRRKHDLISPRGLAQAAQELMSLISLIKDTTLKNRYRYEVFKRLNIEERDLQYEVRQARSFSSEQDEAGQADLGSVPPPENEWAALEREVLRFLFHEPAWIEPALQQIDLAGLKGLLERRLGVAILEALDESKLPPDLKDLSQGQAGSLVARELLPRLRKQDSAGKSGQTQSEDGKIKIEADAQALCIALAETAPKIGKLGPQAHLEMLIRPLRDKALHQRHQESQRLVTDAKLKGDAATSESVHQEAAALRKALKGITCWPTKQTKKGG
jgi:DNA primase